MSNEIWEYIPDYPRYQVSTLGRIRKTNTTRGPTFVKPQVNKRGYCQLQLYNNGVRKNVKVHRIVAQVFIPNPEDKEQVNHKNGDKLNNTLENLEWMTNAENIQHAIDNGFRRWM